MNRRQFLQLLGIVPASIMLLKFTKLINANEACQDCLPKLIYSSTNTYNVNVTDENATNVKLNNFGVRRNIFERLLGIFR